MNEKLLEALQKAKEVLEEGGFKIINEKADDGEVCCIEILVFPPSDEVSALVDILAKNSATINYQPVGTRRWKIANIIGDDKVEELWNADFIVVMNSREKERRKKRIARFREQEAKIEALILELESIRKEK